MHGQQTAWGCVPPSLINKHAASLMQHADMHRTLRRMPRQVWVKPELRDDGKLYWKADSDSQLTKGLAALLVLGFSGCTAEEVRVRNCTLRHGSCWGIRCSLFRVAASARPVWLCA